MPHALNPRIDSRRCTGCERCVDLCPTKALVQIDGKAQLAYPDLCTHCTVCEDICPEGAIALPFLVVFAPSQRTPTSGRNVRR